MIVVSDFSVDVSVSNTFAKCINIYHNIIIKYERGEVLMSNILNKISLAMKSYGNSMDNYGNALAEVYKSMR